MFSKKTETKKTKPKKKLTWKKDSFWGKHLFVILAFLIPFLFMFVLFAIKKVSPFGNNQILVTDLWHQYYPFLVDFQDKLQHGGSLLWTWKSGGGTNYVALMAYYLASPLNFLSVFVPAEYLREFLYVITCVKIGCAGMFFAMFLKITFRRNDISITIFGISYALCSFIMGYYWNVIWLDTIALLPLVIAGTFALLRYGRFRLYIVSLALSVLANYYIGLFTCIFVLLVSIGYSIVEFKGVKNLVKNFLKMAGCTVVSLMITAILTVPTYYALGHTHSADNSFPANFAVNMNGTADFAGVLQAMGKTIANSVAYINPTTKEGLPNVYCGVIAIVLGFLFLACSKIKVRERVFCAFLLVFFLLSFAIRQLDYIWHGFHFPNMLPYRFSFLYSFVLIYMAFRVFMHIEDIRLISIFFSVAGVLAVLAIAQRYDESTAIIITAFVAFIVIVWLMLFCFRIVPKNALAAGLCIIAVAEGGLSAYLGVNTVGTTDGSYYPLGAKDTLNCVEKVNELESGNTDLARTEVTKYFTLNDDALIGIDGVSMFNSMTNESITAYMEKFGLCGWIASNRYTYMDNSPFTNMLLNIKYLISPSGYYLDTIHNDLIYQSSNIKLLENNLYVPQGFMVNADVLDYSVSTASSNPFENQNRMFNLMTGLDGDLYEFLEVVSQGHTDYETFPVTKNSYGNYTFTLNDSSVTPHVKYNYEAPYDGVACAYFTASGTENVTLKVNDENVNSNYIKRPYIMTMGTVHAGDKLSLYADLSGTSGSVTVYCAMINEDLLQAAYEKFSANAMKASKVTDTVIQGNITASEDGLLYTSISYVDGWHAYVDGQEVEITPVGGAELAFPVSAGTHIITIKYIPEGFVVGVAASLAGVLVFALMCVWFYVIKKKKTASGMPPTSENAPADTLADDTPADVSDDDASVLSDEEQDPDADEEPEISEEPKGED